MRGAIGRLLALALLVTASGCELEPFCLNCVDASTEADAGPFDAGSDAGPVERDAGPVDACLSRELCNEVDDDCDGEVDEGFDLTTDVDHCGACGDACAPDGAFGDCNDGVCEIFGCDVGRHDLNGEIADGCEYRCLASAEDDAVCDLLDNDCDDEIDEDVALETDVDNCGQCGLACRFANAGGSCVAGECVMGECEENFFDSDGRSDNGCELSCTPASPADEICNGADDDCDGTIDEGDPGGGASCGSSVGECVPGALACRGGRLDCVGGVLPRTELCNGADDDCDGTVDENDPEGGRLCGTNDGVCVAGRETCVDGAVACVGRQDGGPELCNGLDDDCDGSTDENNPGGGAQCGGGSGVGECRPGVIQCVGGSPMCQGEVGPVDEVCNGDDDDCDGMVDENNPGGGAACGTDQGVCDPGTSDCQSGVLVCVGETPPRPGGELCNALDDDCDGGIDEGNPEGGALCGLDLGECSFGTVTCAGGELSCTGETNPSPETCNDLDDDCDGGIDETTNFQSDRFNCGSCGNECTFLNASGTCQGGSCVQGPCDSGFHDVDAAPGCEYACTVSGGEACNARDDDCDGATDEGLTPPMSFCNPNGVCAGTSASCGAMGYVCEYPSTYEEPEVSCDGLDNDCDGSVDEPFPGIGEPCFRGVGECQTQGVNVCTSASSAACTAGNPGSPTLERCDNLDNDCDGVVDEGQGVGGANGFPPGPNGIPVVQFVQSGTLVRMMRYEASRPDASASEPGSRGGLACGNAGVLPWADVTWQEANDACCALNGDGVCDSGGSGWRLCDSEDWQRGCAGPSAACDWSYSSNCTASSPLTCNGAERDLGQAVATGADAACFTPWSGGAEAHDMSGNLKEWTATPVGSDIFEIRGGSYTNLEAGRTCDFDFTVGAVDFGAPNVGFRCCFY